MLNLDRLSFIIDAWFCKTLPAYLCEPSKKVTAHA